MDHIYLVGAEDVSRAASRMQEAAGRMESASNQMYETMERHCQLFEALMCRLEVLVEAAKEE